MGQIMGSEHASVLPGGDAHRHPPAAGGTTGSERGPVNDPREIFGWTMYDWANSAFVTTVATVLLGPYLTRLAQAAVGENGVIMSLGPFGNVTAKSLYPDAVSLSVILQVFFLPLLGALADYTNLKKRLMASFAYLGVVATCLLFFVTPGLYLLGAGLYIVANLGFGAAVVLYNAYLNDITTPEMRDRVSSRGYALGYLGGGLLLALNLGLVTAGPSFGIDRGLAVRLSLLSAGLWWGGFAMITFARLRTREAPNPLPPGASITQIGFREFGQTLRELRRLPHTLRLLVGYLLYNDGIQTVIGLASVFLAQELFVARGLEPDESFLIGLILMVQFIAMGGSLFFERVAAVLGTKRAILASLVVWSAVVIYAYGFLQTTTQAWLMGAVIAVVLGGSQALSRSLFSRTIPAGKEASFFGIYEIAERGTSWIGPLIFARVVAATGSYRQAILSVIVLFVSGMIVLALTNTKQAERDAAEATARSEKEPAPVPATRADINLGL
jgi:MFS transporter, UMF1 family